LNVTIDPTWVSNNRVTKHIQWYMPAVPWIQDPITKRRLKVMI
jgi:hypothetical protein